MLHTFHNSDELTGSNSFLLVERRNTNKMSNWEEIDDILPIGLLVYNKDDYSTDSVIEGSERGCYVIKEQFPDIKRHYLSPVFEELEYEEEDYFDDTRSNSQLSQLSIR